MSLFSGKPSSSGSLFGNKNAQNQSSGGGLFGNSSQRPEGSLVSNPPKTSLFGSAKPIQNHPPSNDNPTYGTMHYIGKPHVYQNRQGALYTCITGAIQSYSLDELRIKDHSLNKRNFLFPEKPWVDAIIATNIRKRDENLEPSSPHSSSHQTHISPSGGIFGSSQPASQTITQSTASFGGATQPPKASGSLFGASKPTASSLFGSSKPAQANPTVSGSLVGVPQPLNPCGFGSMKPVQPNPAASGSLFGVSQPTASGLFGSSKPGQTNPTTPKNASQFSQLTVADLFGSKKPAQTDPTPNKQDIQATQPQKVSGNMFGASQPTASSLSGRSKPVQANPAPTLQSNQDVTQQTQPKETRPEKQESSPQPVVQGSSMKLLEEANEAERGPEKKGVVLNPGSFSYEVNKMVLVSSFISLLQNHKVSVPENLLDNSDFVPQLFKFLEQFNMNLPTTNIPQFPLNALSSFFTQSETQSQSSSTARKENARRGSQEEETKVAQEEVLAQVTNSRESLPVIELSLKLLKEEEALKEEVLPQPTDEMKTFSMVESPLKLIKEEESEEEEEKVDIQEEKGEGKNKQAKDEDDDKQEEEDLAESSGGEDAEKGILSIAASQENPEHGGHSNINEDC